MMAKPARNRANPALRLAAIRQWHTYLGAFIAPSVLFFALTGSLQLFALHEAHGAYRPPLVIEKLGMVHKDQVFAAKPKRAPPPATAGKPKAEAAKSEPGPKTSTKALKWLFLAVAAGLVISTCLGLWMALFHNRNKGVAWVLFLAGAAVPVLILALL
jgi:hypothetical protein